MASNLFDPTIEATASSADSWELENERRRIEHRLPWFLFIRSASFARLSVRRRAFQETGQLVGRGACSDVYRYRMTNQWDLEELRHDSHMIKQTLELGDVVALKRVRPPTVSSEGLALVAAAKEIRVMMNKDIRQHENLVQLLAVNWEHRGDDGALWPTLVTEFCDCTLKDLLLSGKLSPETKGDLMHGIGAGIDALHEAGFVHGDLKCENVLMKHLGNGYMRPKVSDFGASVELVEGGMVHLYGTDPWRAPECISETGGVRAIVAEVAPLADLYSFGMLIWVVVRDGSNPFQELYDLEDTLVADSKISTLAADSNTGLWDETNLADLRRQVRLATNQTIAEFKRNGQLGPMVKTDLARIMGSSDVLSMHDFTWRILTLLLEPEPCKRSETTDAWMDRVNSVAKLDKPRPDTPADKPAGEPYQLSYGIFKNELVLHGNMSIDIKPVINSELKDYTKYAGEKTRKKVFNELYSFLCGWEDTHPPCRGCCEFTPLDRVDQLCTPSMEEILQSLEEKALLAHSCLDLNAMSYGLEFGPFPVGSDAFSNVVALYTCYTEGYGTVRDHEAGLQWLIKGAQWGSNTCQWYGPALYFRRYRTLPPDIPSISWLANAVLMQNMHTARAVLQASRPNILSSIDQLRSRMMGPVVSIDNWRWGLEVRHWSAGDMAEIMDQLTQKEPNVPTNWFISLRNWLADSLSLASGALNSNPGFWSKLSKPLPFGTKALLNDNVESVVDGNGPLHLAASNWTEPVDFCRKLLDKFPSAIDGVNDRLETPLILASRAGRMSMVTVLVERGADTTVSAGSGGDTALHWLAIHPGSLDQIEAVLESGADIDHLMKDTRYYPGCSLGLALSPCDSLRPGTPLSWAIQADNEPVCRYLLHRGANPLLGIVDGSSPVEHSSPIKHAVYLRNPRLLRLCLVSLGDIPSSLELYYTYFTDVTRTGRLYAGSTEDKELEILQIIGDNTPAMSSVGQIKGYFYTPLRIAVQSMSPRLAACIWDAMERKAASVGLEIPWNRGEYTYDLPALAIKRNSPEMLEYILKRGATMGYTDLDAQLLFDLANGPDSTELLHILVQYGLDFGHRNPSGFLPLHVAIIRGNLKLAQTLVDFMTDEEFESMLGARSRFPWQGAAIPGEQLSFLGHLLMRLDATITPLQWLFGQDRFDSESAFFNVAKLGKTTALHLAVEHPQLGDGAATQFNQHAILQFLVSHFRSPEYLNARNYHDVTPLHLAAWMGRYDDAMLLVQAGVDINAISGVMGTPLDVTFTGPPSVLYSAGTRPTREIAKLFVDGRNRIAEMLRRYGSKAWQEIGSARKLGNWVPFPYGIKLVSSQSPLMQLLLTGRFLCRRYGCPVVPPRFEPPVSIPGLLKVASSPLELGGVGLPELLDTL